MKKPVNMTHELRPWIAPGLPDCQQLAERLNTQCQCVSIDRGHLRHELEQVPDGGLLAQMIEADRPHLFAGSTVFVSEVNIRRMQALIAAIETVVQHPAYQAEVLQYAPQSAHHVTAARGVFLGYDFHLPVQPDAWPQLIEINTNAGGALLNAHLARAQQSCCAEVATLLPGAVERTAPEELFLAMFLEEWQRVRGHEVLRTIAIVDDHPEQQYLYPEFVLFHQLFERHGLKAIICAPTDLSWQNGQLQHEGQAIDMVYNRLTDFPLDEPDHAVLYTAWLADAVVMTPHPQAHALYADKRNLILFSDMDRLAAWGIPLQTREVLAAAVPRTELVTAARAAALWAGRRQLFFKPARGYGSKAAYRGDKLTKRVFDEILHGSAAYIAQALAPPSLRQLNVAGALSHLKLDLRNYVYAGQVQLVAARLWQGQTTNFRTPGGGFAPVLAIPCPDGLAAHAAQER